MKINIVLPRSIILLGLFFFISQESTGQPFVVNGELSTRNGLSQNSAYAIHQGEYGFIWIANQVAIERFSPGHIQSIWYNNLTKTNWCETTVIVEDTIKNNLWIGTNKGLALIKTDTDSITIFRYSNSYDLDIRSIHLVTSDSILLGSISGLYIATVRSNDSLSISKKNILTSAPIVRSIIRQKDYYLIGTSKGLFKFDTGLNNSVQLLDSTNNITDLYYDAFHNTTLIAINTLGVFSFKEFSSGSQNASLIHKDSIAINLITKIGDQYLFGTEGRGVIVIPDLSSSELLINREPLTGTNNQQIRAIAQSRDGVIWIGTRGGGIKLIRNPIQKFNRFLYPGAEFNPKNFIWFIFQEPNNDSIAYVGTEKGLVIINIKNTEIISRKNEGIAFLCATYWRKKEKIIIGTHTKGLYIFDIRNQVLSKFAIKDDLSINEKKLSVKSLFLDNEKDRLFIGTNNGIMGYDLFKESALKISNKYGVAILSWTPS